jgi:uncharacterized protein (DUF1501 family)
MTKDWLACDGTGGDAPTPRIVSRRAAIGRVIAGAALAQWAGRSALAQVAVDTPGTGRDVLVTLFLRGGADGLSVVVPHGDGDYYRARPTLGLSPDTVLDLDGFFGLHPSLAALLPLYKDGRMAAIHAVGSQDRTRSHFEAMATVERGLLDNRATEASGWLGRYLAATPAAHASPLRAVAWGDLLPDSLRGARRHRAVVAGSVPARSAGGPQRSADGRPRRPLRRRRGRRFPRRPRDAFGTRLPASH